MIVKAKLMQLKPCPFCGEAHELYFEQYEKSPGTLRWRVGCARCMAQIDRGYDQSTEGLVTAWNKRYPRCTGGITP